MELNAASRMALDEAAVVAQEVGMSGNVNANLVFYGLLRLARGKLTSGQEGVFDSIEKLQDHLRSEDINIEATEKALKGALGAKDAAEKDEVLKTAEMVAGVLGDGEVYPHVIASVILDAPSPTLMRSLVWGSSSATPKAQEYADAKIVDPSMHRADFDPAPVQAPMPEQGAVRKPPSTPPVTPMPEGFNLGGGNAFGGGAEIKNGRRSVFQSSGHIFLKMPEAPKEYAGKASARSGKGTSVGARIVLTVLYFALVVGVPYLVAMLNGVLPAVENIVRGMPTRDFGLVAAVLVWAAFVVNTISVALNKVSPCGKVFVQFLIGITFVTLLGVAAVQVVPLSPVPFWLKIAVLVVNLLIVFLSLRRLTLAMAYHIIDYQGSKPELREITGILQEMVFSFIVKSFVLPMIALFVLSLFMDHISGGWLIACQIYAFFWAFAILDYLLQAIGMRAQSSPYTTAGKRKVARILIVQGRLLVIPVFGLFLLSIFGWWPMPIWLSIIYGIYMAGWLMVSIAFLKMEY